MEINVIGAGLAGSEAALQLSKRGLKVNLYEMRPKKSTGAHKTDKFAEFVCSNSLGASDCSNASGLLKKEMEILGGELITIARECSVPAGNALAIDRELFSETVTRRIEADENINVIKEEVTLIPDGYTIMASGPLTSDKLADSIKEFTQSEHLHFFDAIAPIVEKDSINFDKAFWASRYDKGEASYINCPMNKCEYDPSLSKTDAEKAALKEKCQVVLDSALRDKNLNLVCREEDAPWNVGLCCNVIYEGKAREYFYRQFKNSIEAYLKQGAPPNMTGGAFDSFSAGQTVTYVDESNPRPGDGYLPYFLLDPDQKPFVCLHAAMFEGFKDYMVYSPQGMLMNTFYVPPEMVKYQVNAGFEVGLSSETGFEYSKYYRKYFWGMRFNGGCHSISHVENRNREYSIKYVESYMSIMASYGSASSWFSADAANENFWTSPESFTEFRPTLERWMPKLNEAFNGTIFYANGLGMVTMEFPEDGQNPPIDELDISSTALFCRPDSQASDGVVECYLSIFLGYQSKEAPQGFSRVAKVNIKGATSLSCWFVANDMTCSKSGDTVTVALRNVGSGQTYRTAIVKFERNGHDNSKAIAIGVSVAVVVLLCAIGAVIAVFLIRKKKKNVDKLRGDVHVAVL